MTKLLIMFVAIKCIYNRLIFMKSIVFFLLQNSIMSMKGVVMLFLIIYISNSFSLLSPFINPKQPYSVPDIIRSNGYSAEIHKVRTKDNYILELHRILPNGKNGSGGKAAVVFMHHCLLCTSYEFVINTPNTSLGYILADAGYDVWLANSRGNYFSRNHATLSPNEKEFWNFSLDEISLIDLPAGIDYALNVTGQKELYYIGYSMGAAAIMALLSDKIEYNEKIRFLILVAPAAYVENSRGPLINIGAKMIEKLYRMLGIHEVLERNVIVDSLLSSFCSEPIAPVCESFMEQIIGLKSKYIKTGLLSTILSHTPGGTSLNNIAHFSQAASSGKFRKYNLGSLRNIELYGTKEPPIYNLTLVSTPTAMFSSEDDWLASPQDVQRVAGELRNVMFHKKIIGEDFSHVDFFWAERAEWLIYRDIIKLLRTY